MPAIVSVDVCILQYCHSPPYRLVEPDIAQSYIVPAPGSYSAHSSINDSAVFSMWEYFLDFLATDSLSVVTQPRAVPPLNPYQANNRFTGKSRLPVFRNLSQGIPLV